MRIAFFGDSLTEGRPGASFLERLAVMLPDHRLENYGRRGDTVVSLYRRIERMRVKGHLDLAVLWVGVNDVLATVSRGHLALKGLMRQPRSDDPVQFRDYYLRTVMRLRRSAPAILTISPLLIGEDLANPWNRSLEELGRIVRAISASLDGVVSLDLRPHLISGGSELGPSEYVPRSVTRMGLDSVFLRSPGAVDRLAARRGLRVTLDGVHLNSLGAQRVAKAVRRAIEELTGSSSS